MGRPFANELAQLDRTYLWALSEPVAMLRSATYHSHQPLLAIGSGGSLTAATYAAYLHEQINGQLARSATPVDATWVVRSLQDFDAIFVSAGGKNRDALSSCRSVLDSEPRSLSVLCASTNSPLAKMARECGRAVLEFSPVSGKDGFLAVNSLLAFSVLIYRAFAPEGDGYGLEPSLAPLLGAPSLQDYAIQLQEVGRKAVLRDSFVVLHGPCLRAAAQDMESKFVEAALGSVQVADYRNFAHGRHHWLAKRGSSSAVVAFIHDSDEPLASRTLALIPKDIPLVRIRVHGSALAATIPGLAACFHFTELVGRARKIDPGKPGVPQFGSRLYSLRARTREPQSLVEVVALRKAKVCGFAEETQNSWQKLANLAIQKITSARFHGLAVDYDGTLCTPQDRFEPLRKEVIEQLRRLLRAGLRIGIATGRGQSALKSLRAALPQETWNRVVVGYYNGGCVLQLAHDLPKVVKAPAKQFAQVLNAMQGDAFLARFATIEPRKWQVTIECKTPANEEAIWDCVQMHVLRFPKSGIVPVRSSHSIDLLAPQVSKNAVIAELERQIPGPILRVGDKGKFPGNDFQLLNSPFGLSVDEVSTSSTSCWNVAPAGVLGVEATLLYLQGIERLKSGFRLVLDRSPT